MSYAVLHVRSYDFKDDDGKRVRGATVKYVDLTGVREDGELGLPVLSVTVSPELAPRFEVVPGTYEMDWRQRSGKAGKPTLVLVSAELLEPLSLGENGGPF